MKKISILFLLSLLLIGCKKEEPIKEIQKEEPRIELEEMIIVEQKEPKYDFKLVSVSYEDTNLDIIHQSNIEELNETGYVLLNSTCKQGPGEDYNDSFDIYINEEVKIKGFIDEWYLIEYKGLSGYALNKNISKEKSIIEPNELIVNSENTEDYIIDKTNEEIEKLPDNIYNLLKNDWKIYLTNEDLDDKFFDGALGSVPGATVWNKKEIYIQNNYDKLDMTVLHELGHAVDCELKINEQEEWKQIYNEEKELATFMTEHCKSTIKEYFADSFSNYIKNPEELNEKCPKTYIYIEKIMLVSHE